MRHPGGIFARFLPLLLVVAVGCSSADGATRLADIAIVNGRVMDPASGTDAVMNVLIRGDRVVAVTASPVTAARVIDATGLVVAPGFVDILAGPSPDREPQEYKIKDGVTTVVGMHGGPVDTDGWYRRFSEDGGSLHNYGITVGDRSLRAAVGVTDRNAAASEAQRREIRRLAAQAIDAGAVGIGFGINYVPGMSYEEVLDLFEVAAQKNVPAHLHMRYKGGQFPGSYIAAAHEVISAAAVTGASAQFAHAASSSIGTLPVVMRMIEGARRNGIDVMADMHVYTGNRTSIDSALYDEGWEATHGGVTVDSVFIPSLGRRLRSQEEFAHWREQGGPVTVFHIRLDEIILGLQHPHMMITSDGITTGELSHPRGAGTFARTLGHFSREQGQITLMEALRKMTVMPAERLERSDPTMAQRGRIGEGSFADITVFDPATIIDRATFENGAQYSEGVEYVLVNGVVVLDRGEFVGGVAPGQPVRRPAAR
jgi:N-acyl-D-aspartate/D-glutamate deacylase